jgi:ppGpp synthetase/RelA/SpoT-type nucleotidyltranferase
MGQVYLSNSSEINSEIEAAATEFTRMQPAYDEFASEVSRIFKNSLPAEDMKYQSIQHRTKSVTSFKRKCGKLDANGQPKYSDPLNQITDLAGVRVIAYTLQDVENVARFIERTFCVKERKNLGEERFDQGSFGYQSIHYLVEFSDARLSLPEFSRHRGRVCEIQVRTVLQHAWAEIEHDVQYKTVSELPRTLRKKFSSLAGLLEIADREFQSIRDEDNSLRERILEDLQGDLTHTVLTNTTQEGGGTQLSADIGNATAGVRTLLSEKQYDKAIRIYDRMISEHPWNFTLYLGRSKARFLSGDAAGALLDVTRAEQMNPRSSAVTQLKTQITEGTLGSPENRDQQLINTLQNQARTALRSGRGEEAYFLYLEAQDAGASLPFSLLNRVLCCIVARDYEGASALLKSLRINPGTPMEINIRFVRGLLADIDNSSLIPALTAEISHLVEQKEYFSLSLSPLNSLLDGVKATGDFERIEAFPKFFACLSG